MTNRIQSASDLPASRHTIVVGSLTVSVEELRSAVWSESAALTDNGRDAIAFCHAWLSGAVDFQVQTSGSTGDPKPIALTRKQMQASAHATGQALGLAAGMHALVCLPTRYIAGKMMLVRGLELGLHLIVTEPASDPLAALPAGCQVDFTAFVPLQMQAILTPDLRYANFLNRMHAILIGGGPVDRALVDAMQAIQAPIYHTYGMTETATHVALRRLNGPAAADAFTLLPGVACQVDERGCLALHGPMTNDLWLQTNDLVALQEDGAFVWLGRWDNVINSGGVKVQVEQVERTLEQLLGVREFERWRGRRAFVTGLPDARLGQMVVLVVEGEAQPSQGEQELLAALRGALGAFAAPRRVVYLPHFALTPTSKIDRRTTLQQLG